MLNSVKQLNSIFVDDFPLILFVEPKTKPKEVIHYYLAEEIEKEDFDMQQFFSNLANQRRSAIVQNCYGHKTNEEIEEEVNICMSSLTPDKVPDRKNFLLVSFFEKKKIEEYLASYEIIDGHRFLSDFEKTE